VATLVHLPSFEQSLLHPSVSVSVSVLGIFVVDCEAAAFGAARANQLQLLLLLLLLLPFALRPCLASEMFKRLSRILI